MIAGRAAKSLIKYKKCELLVGVKVKAGDVDQQVYSEPSVVSLYSRHSELQPAEQAILEHLRPRLVDLDVLDMGVGAGRTAVHFGPAARSYLGVDYAEPMIAACRRRLPGMNFQVGDARAMDFAGNESFDVVMFSYNGIDHLTETEREQFLRDAMRILRPGGYLIFSTHNTNYIPALIESFRFRIGRSVRETLRTLRDAIRFRLRNPGIHSRTSSQRGLLVDGLYGFRSVGVYYIRPDQQVEDLIRLGAKEILCAGNTDSALAPADRAIVRQWNHPWVYYVCRKPRH